MEDETFNTEVEKKKFLRVCCPPATTFLCKGCSLRVAVIMALITDFIFALIKLIEFMQYVGWFLEASLGLEYRIFVILWHGCNFGVLICGVFGAIGIVEESARKLNIYSVFKQVEFFLILALRVWLYIEDFDDVWVWVFLFINIVWNLTFTYYVWSATMRLYAGQLSMVMYGVEIITGVESGQVVIPGQAVQNEEVEFGQVSVSEDQ